MFIKTKPREKNLKCTDIFFKNIAVIFECQMELVSHMLLLDYAGLCTKPIDVRPFVRYIETDLVQDDQAYVSISSFLIGILRQLSKL